MSGAATAIGIGAAVGGIGSIAGGAMQSSAAKSAAQQQSQAAQQAAQLQYQASQNALDFQKQQWATEQQQMQPWINTGQGALSNLAYRMGIGTPDAYAGAPTAPTSATLPAPSTPNAPTQPGFGAPLAGTGASQPTLPVFQSGSTRNPYGPVRGVLPLSGPAPVSGVVGAMQDGSHAGPGPIPGVGARLQAPPGVTAPSGNPPTAGAGANPSAGSFGSLMAPNPYGTFNAPTAAQMEANDPGYQARLNLGEQALEHSAAARGGVLTGGTAQAENQYAQDYASNEYNNYYNQTFNTNAANYNAFAQNQANQYNRLAAMSGLGQQTAGQLGTLGTEMSGQVGSNLLNTAGAMGQQYNNAAAANASGMVGSANAWGGALSGIGGNMSNLLMMQSILGGGTNPYQTLYNAQQYPSAANMPGLE